MYLGLDVSTSCTGWCLLSYDKSLIDVGFFDLSKIKCHYDKSDVMLANFENIKERFCVDKEINEVFIEQDLRAFRSGLSSAHTISSLSRFNGIVSYLSNKTFNTKPIHINVNTARKTLGIKIEREKVCGISTKHQVLDWVSCDMGGFLWPQKQMKGGPNKGKIVLDKRSYDMADAYVIAKAGIEMNKL
jgi:hypothetical protein